MYAEAPVQRAIEETYAIFSRYPPPARRPAPDPMADERLFNVLSRSPLRSLSEEAVGLYSRKAIWSLGTAEDYKYFLPRILDHAVRGRTSWVGLEATTVAKKLIYAEWWHWPPNEQRAIRAVFAEAWIWTCRRRPDEADAGDWLCALALLGLDVACALRGWITPPCVEAVLQLAANLRQATAPIVEHPETYNHWVVLEPATRRSIGAWYRTAAVREAFTWAAGEASGHDLWAVQRAMHRLATLGAAR